jgi:hypothetical protein
MRLKGAVQTERRSLILHQAAQCRLEMLRERTEASSDSDVVRDALRYYEELVEDDAGGKKLLFRDASGHDFDIPLTSSVEETAKDEGPLVKRNLILHSRSATRLDALRKSTNASSDSKLVREALRVYDLLVENALAGKRLVVRDAKGNEEAFRIPGLRERRPFQFFDRLRGQLER